MTDSGYVSLASPGSRRLDGYLAVPQGDPSAGSGPWPGLVLVHEAFGLDGVMLDHARRMAAQGYLTLAVDLYTVGGAARCLVATMRAMSRGRGQAYDDIEAARQWLLASPSCTGRVGVIGFCMGGGFALLAAGTGFDVAAVNYGMLPADLDEALAGACPVVGSYGGADRSLKGAAARLDHALTRLGVEHDVREYPGAGHSFLNDAENGPRLLRPLLRVTGVGPEPVAAAQAWSRIDAFLAAHLKNPVSDPGA
jgi:carboxymethylenebutenolidase